MKNIKIILSIMTLFLFTCNRDLGFEYTFKMTAITENDNAFIGDEVIIDFHLLGSSDLNYRTQWNSETKGEFYYDNKKIDKGSLFEIKPGKFQGKFIPLEQGDSKITFRTISRGDEKPTSVEISVSKFDYTLEIPEKIEVIAGKDAEIVVNYESGTDQYDAKLEYTITDEEGEIIDTYTTKELPNPYELKANEELDLLFKYPNKLGTYIIIWEYSNNLGDKSVKKTKVIVKGYDYALEIPEKIEITAGTDVDFTINHTSETTKYEPKLSYSISDDYAKVMDLINEDELSNPYTLTTDDNLKLQFVYPNKTGVYTITWEYTNTLKEKQVYKTKIIVKGFDYTLEIPEKIEVVAGNKADFAISYKSETEKYNPIIKYSVSDNGGGVYDANTDIELSNPIKLSKNSNLQLEFKYPNKTGVYNVIWEYSNDLGDNLIYKTKIIVKSFDYTLEIPEKLEVVAGDNLEFEINYNSETSKYNPKLKHSINGNNGKLINLNNTLDLESPYFLQQNEKLSLQYLYPNKSGEYFIIWEYLNELGDTQTKKTTVYVKGFDYTLEIPELIEVTAGNTAAFDITYKSSTSQYNPKLRYSLSNSNSSVNLLNTNEPLENPFQLKQKSIINAEFKYPNKAGEYFIFWEYTNSFGDTMSLKTKIVVKGFDYTLEIPELIEVTAGNTASFDVVYKSITNQYNQQLSYSISNNDSSINFLNSSETLLNPYDLSKQEILNLEFRYPNKPGEYFINWEYKNDLGDKKILKTKVVVKGFDYTLEIPELIEVTAGNFASLDVYYNSSTSQYSPQITYNLSDSNSQLTLLNSTEPLSNPYKLSKQETIKLEFKYPNKSGDYFINWEYTNSFGDKEIYKTKIVVKGFNYTLDIPKVLEVNAGEKADFDVLYKSTTSKFDPVLKYTLSGNSSQVVKFNTSEPLSNPHYFKKEDKISLEFKYPNKSGEYYIFWEYSNSFGDKESLKTKVIVNAPDYSLEIPELIEVTAGDSAPFKIVYKSSSDSFNPTLNYTISDGKILNSITSQSLVNPYKLKQQETINVEFNYPNKSGEYVILWEYTNSFGDTKNLKTRVIINPFKYNFSAPSEVVVYAGDVAEFDVQHSTDGAEYQPKVTYKLSDSGSEVLDALQKQPLPNPYDLSVSNVLKINFKYPRKIGDYIIEWTYNNGFGIEEVSQTKIKVVSIPFDLKYSSTDKVLAGDLASFSLKVIPSQTSNQKYSIKSIRKLNLESTPKLFKSYSNNSTQWTVGSNFPNTNEISGFFGGDGIGENRGVEITVQDEYGQEKTVKHLYSYYMRFDFRSDYSKKAGKSCKVTKKWYNHKYFIYLKNQTKTKIEVVEIKGNQFAVNLEPGKEVFVSNNLSTCSVCGIKEPCPLDYIFDVRFRIDGVWSNMTSEDIR